MTTIRYNALSYLEKLKLSGLNAETAKVIVQEQENIITEINASNSDIKYDVNDIKLNINELRLEMKDFKNDIKSEVKNVHTDIKSIYGVIESLQLKLMVKLGMLGLGYITVLGFILKK